MIEYHPLKVGSLISESGEHLDELRPLPSRSEQTGGAQLREPSKSESWQASAESYSHPLQLASSSRRSDGQTTCSELDSETAVSKQRGGGFGAGRTRVAVVGCRPVESISGFIRRVDEGRAVIEFSKERATVLRSVDIATLEGACNHKIRPGDLVALRTYRCRDGLLTNWQFLGRGAVKLSKSKVEQLDELRRRAYRRKS